MKKYFFALLLVTFLAFGQTINFYFWHDDYTILYSIQQPTSKDAGYGSGVIGRPYGYAVTPFIPFYYIFGIEPTGYYFMAVILYFLAALTVFYFAKTLTNNKLVAFGASLIFASGYPGSESIYALFSSWQNVLSAILITLSTTLYYKYIKSKKLETYLLVFLFYLFTMEFAFLRSHGIILIILGLEMVFNFKGARSLFRVLPFALSYWYFYAYSTRTMIDTGSKFPEIFQHIFIERNFHLLLTPIQTLQNVLIPDKWGIPLIIFSLGLAGILVWKKSKILIFSLIFIIANFLVYYYVFQESPQQTTHRYLTISFVGGAIFIAFLLHSFVKNTSRYLFLCLIIVLINIVMARQDQIGLLSSRSEPSKQFWQEIKKEVPNLPKRSALYFDVKEDGVSKPDLDAALGVGSMSTTASVAVHYSLLWEETYLPENFAELLSLVKSNLIDRDNIHTFFYSRGGKLVNTTKLTRDGLSGKIGIKIIDDLNNVNTSLVSPKLLNFNSSIDLNFSNIEYKNDNQGVIVKYLPYFSSRDGYFQKASISSSSELKYAEIKNIKDSKNETSWRATEDSWTKLGKEEVVINLGEVVRVGGIKLVLAVPKKAPTVYSYHCSLDGISWQELASFNKQTIASGLDKVNDSNCIFVKLIIDDTLLHDAPQIAELEVVDGSFTDLDFELASKIEENPFAFLSSESDLQSVQAFLISDGIPGKICLYTDKYKEGKSCNSFKFRLDAGLSNSIFLEPQGTNLQKIEFEAYPQVKISVGSGELETLTYDQLDKMGYIQNYVD